LFQKQRNTIQSKFYIHKGNSCKQFHCFGDSLFYLPMSKRKENFNGVVKILRNAIILSALIALVGIFFHFISGNYVGNRLEGTWRAICTRDEITFTGDTFDRGRETGVFRVRANLIFFCESCSGYPLRITAEYMMINGIIYFRV